MQQTLQGIPPNSNWNATTQFVNHAKQIAMLQSGNHQLAALFGNPGGQNAFNMGGNGPMPPDGFMRPPLPSIRMSGVGGPGPGQQFGRKMTCSCPNCSGTGGRNPFPGPPGPPMEPQTDVGRGNRVIAFTSQLTGLPIPEHPSSLFPSVDFVMVPASGNSGCDCGCGQHNSLPNFTGGAARHQSMPQMNNQQSQYGCNGNSSNNGGGNFYNGGNGAQMNSLF
ncbi:hypothetical protein Aperf_G00000109458 [Anoplocephala perfoliata]